MGRDVSGEQRVRGQASVRSHAQGVEVVADCAGAIGKAASRSKGSYFSAHYARIKGRRGHGKATVAVAHSILVVAYYVLLREVPYQDLGADYLLETVR